VLSSVLTKKHRFVHFLKPFFSPYSVNLFSLSLPEVESASPRFLFFFSLNEDFEDFY